MTSMERKYFGHHVETDDGQRGIVHEAIQDDDNHVTLYVTVGSYAIRTDSDHAAVTHYHVGD